MWFCTFIQNLVPFCWYVSSVNWQTLPAPLSNSHSILAIGIWCKCSACAWDTMAWGLHIWLWGVLSSGLLSITIVIWRSLNWRDINFISTSYLRNWFVVKCQMPCILLQIGGSLKEFSPDVTCTRKPQNGGKGTGSCISYYAHPNNFMAMMWVARIVSASRIK